MGIRAFVFSIALLPAAAGSQTVINASSWLPATHAMSIAQKNWCDDVERHTQGGVRCNILPKAVAAPAGTFDAVRDGIADLSFSVDGYTPGRFVFTQIAEFPFTGYTAEATAVAYQKIYAKHFAPLGEHRGVKVLGVWVHGPGVAFNTRRPVTTNAELSALKMRIPGGTVAEVSKAAGWNVTLKPATEAYELMSTGVLDGTFITIESFKSLNLSMVKYATMFPGGLFNTSMAFVMNASKYGALSAEQRAVVDRLSGEHVARLFARGYDQADQAGIAAMKDAKVQITEASPAFVSEVREKIGPVEARWVAAAEGRGLKNARTVLNEFRAEAQAAK